MSLDSLASNKGPDATNASKQTSKRKWSSRLLAWLPLYILIGFLVLAGLLFGQALMPARSLVITTVITQKSEPVASVTPAVGEVASSSVGDFDPFSGEVLFQASGWLEADPYATRATALRDGVVESVFVLEGEVVEEGQLLATLISEDTEISLLQAQAVHAEANALLERDASRLQRAEARLERHVLQVAAFQLDLNILRDDAVRFEAAGTRAYSARDVKQAALRADAGEAALRALQAEATELELELAVLRKEMESAQQRVGRAAAAVQQAQLDLARTQIHSPIAGIIQELFVSPGRMRMLGMDAPESATIAILYDPKKLQARIDVPLEQAAQLSLGQPVIVRTNLIPDREFKASVSRIVGMADIQRNTLQVKVALVDPDPRMRPEMLCRGEFLSTPQSLQSSLGASSAQMQQVSIFVPVEALIERSGDRAAVWSLDGQGEKAEKRRIRLGNRSGENHVEVIDGLRPGDPIILNPPADLASGDRVRSEIL